ncbi:MAG: hypothetical protein IPO81_09395 [Kouleothrix sp.]|nr:hypothetical protein [Kouleothrix sp.]
MTTTTPATMIVIVSGQEFSVPTDTSIDDLRAHLSGMFPEVASATVQKGTKAIDGTTYQTIEFVKKAGTKGASGADLLALLAAIPAIRLGLPPAKTAQLLEDVRTGRATIDWALDADALGALDILLCRNRTQTGETLCSQLDRITPVAGIAPVAW